MSARDAFGLVVRLAGLGFCVMSAVSLIYLVVLLLGLPDHKDYTATTALATVIPYGLVGLALLAMAEWLTRRFYGRSDRPSA